MITSLFVSLPFLLIVILVVGIYLYLRYGRGDGTALIGDAKAPKVQAEADYPVNFGYKTLWIATQAPSAAVVAEVMALQKTQPANWQSGIQAAYEDGYIFVSPPVKGWVLAVGLTLPAPTGAATPSPRSEIWSEMMTMLSQQFGVAHFYGSYRVSNYVIWAIYEGGVERRVFESAEDILLNRGELLPEEEVRLRLLPADEADADSMLEDKLWMLDEDDVIALAEAWSINPTTLETLNLPPSIGLVGRFSEH